MAGRMGEFDLIKAYFSHPAHTEGLILGVGDDCALLKPSPGMTLAVTTDMMVSGVHFWPDDDPRDLGHKLAAVNFSDLAAMGARPRWLFLNLTLAAVDERWIAAFADGLFAQAKRYGAVLAGGDTTRGSLAFGLTAMGELPSDQALRRSGARPGDWICVSGVPGEAAAGLAHRLGEYLLPEGPAAQALARLYRPEPRVALGLALRGVATSAIDISDGLAQDLGHILAASKVGATVELARLPSSPVLEALPKDRAWRHQLAGGDDYELLFTLPPDEATRLSTLSTPVTVIGRIDAEPGLRLLAPDGSLFPLTHQGHDHFA
ncbi:MAG: thiamine-phosphate kinase [Gammaproteobacteria bacterium]|nr:thiamine-phosphate kinase [Gammaproteobacteria bacterium]